MKGFFGILAAFVVLWVVLVGVAVATDAAMLTWVTPWRENKRTEVIRNTNQYVTTQQEAIADGWRRYNDPDATEGQKNAAIDDMCRAANRIDDIYVRPEEAKLVMRARGCWDGE